MTRNTTSYREKGRAVFLAALMIMSVVAMSAAFAGGAAANHEETQVPADEGDRLWAGQVGDFDVSTDAQEDDVVDLYKGDDADGEWLDELVVDGDDNVTVDTDGLETGSYFIQTGDNTTDGIEFEIRVQNLDGTSFVDDSVAYNGNTDLEIDSNRANFQTAVSADGLSTEDLESIFEDSVGNATDYEHDEEDFVILEDRGDDFDADFDGIDAGEYVFEFDVTDSTASTTATITVEEEVVIDTDVSFGDIENQQEGDVMEIPIEFEHGEEYDSVGIVIDDGDSNYHANLTVDLADDFDEDELVIDWNTYYAGQAHEDGLNVTNDTIFSADDDLVDNIEVNEQTEIGEDFRLNPDVRYTFSLYEQLDGDSEVDFDNSVASGAAYVEERHTGDASTSIAPSDYAGEDIEDILDAATDADTVAQDDLLIVEQDVSGIFGYGIDADELNNSKGLSFEVTNTEAPAYAEPASFTDSDVEVIAVEPDPDNNKVYFVIQVSDDEGELEDGDVQEWDVEFIVDGNNNAYVDEGETEVAETSYTVTERTVELDLVEAPYQVTPDEDGEIRGSTTLAPGSTVNVEVDKPGEFLNDKDVDVEVNEDGERVFTYTDDEFSEREIGEEFEITLTGDEQHAPVDGIFADTPEWESITQAEELEAYLEELRDQLDVDDNDELTVAVQELQDSEDELNALLDEFDAENASELEAYIADLEDSEQTLTELLESQGVDNVTELENKIADLEDSEQTLTELLAQHNVDSVEELNQKIDDLSEDELAEVLEQYENVDTAEDLHNYIEGLEQDSNELDALLDDYEKESVEDLKQYISGLENDSAALDDLFEKTDTESVDELKTHIDDLNDKISELEGEISDLEGEIADLEDQLESNGDDNGDDDESDDSDDGTPGFGVAVALVALLGAAMLALRRQN